jgi:hypothetical protein
LQELLAAFRPAFGQERPYRRCVALVLGSVFAFARHTLSQVPLRWVPAFPPQAVPSRTPPRTEAQAAAELLWTRRQLDAAGRSDQPLLGIADGAYDTADLWTDLPPRTVLVARCAKSRALFRRPEPPARP